VEHFRRAKQALHWVHVKKETEFDNALPGKTPYGETSNRGTWHGMTSFSRQWTEVSTNGLPDVLVTGITKVKIVVVSLCKC